MMIMLGLAAVASVLVTCRCSGADADFDLLRKRKNPDMDARGWHEEGFAFAERRAADFEILRMDKIERRPFEIARFHVSNVTAEEFRDKYESMHEPLIIDGVPEAEGWGAANWTIPTLARKYPNMTVIVGTDDDKEPIRLSMKDFERYSDTNTDDTPMYVFDWRVYDDDVGKEAMSEYRVPSIFTEDLFQLVQGRKDYPSHRWLLVGPKRSGSNIHNDPLGTSAWNTLLSGRKLWFIAPPHLESALLKTRESCTAKWFLEEVPKIQARYADEVMLYVQHPGETMFVPGFWMHAVLNLDDTTAVTQNIVTSHNFPEAWDYTRQYLPAFAAEWLEKLKLHHGDLGLVADRITADSRFVLEGDDDDDDEDDDDDDELEG